MSQWVKHISGQGKQWEVREESTVAYAVKSGVPCEPIFLPKSEYVLCCPPNDIWKDVTEHCRLTMDGANLEHFDWQDQHWVAEIKQRHGYRLRKISLWDLTREGPVADAKRSAFIVERRES